MSGIFIEGWVLRVSRLRVDRIKADSFTDRRLEKKRVRLTVLAETITTKRSQEVAIGRTII